MISSRLFPAALALALALSPAQAAPNPVANVNLGESEALKCEEKIASIRRDVLGKYEDQLGDLQNTLQKAADLEGALTVRDERGRLAQEHTLSERNYVAEPKALRTLQTQQVTKMQELVAQVVQDTLPKLIELKKSFTVAGKLDEAVAVRTAIEKLQNSHVPVARADAGSVVPAETLLLAYAGDRSRADKTYKGGVVSFCEGRCCAGTVIQQTLSHALTSTLLPRASAAGLGRLTSMHPAASENQRLRRCYRLQQHRPGLYRTAGSLNSASR